LKPQSRDHHGLRYQTRSVRVRQRKQLLISDLFSRSIKSRGAHPTLSNAMLDVTCWFDPISFSDDEEDEAEVYYAQYFPDVDDGGMALQDPAFIDSLLEAVSHKGKGISRGEIPFPDVGDSCVALRDPAFVDGLLEAVSQKGKRISRGVLSPDERAARRKDQRRELRHCPTSVKKESLRRKKRTVRFAA
jgi:hypothetical protein